jgi:hypothetical protein
VLSAAPKEGLSNDESIKRQITLRIVNILKLWIDSQFYDFRGTDGKECVATLKVFSLFPPLHFSLLKSRQCK